MKGHGRHKSWCLPEHSEPDQAGLATLEGWVEEKWGTTGLAWKKDVFSEGHVVGLEHDSLRGVWCGSSQRQSESSS